MGFAAKMRKRKTTVSVSEKPLDAFREKRGRGRPYDVIHSEVIGRAENYRRTFGYIWPGLRGAVLAANAVKEVIEAFDRHASAHASEFIPRLAEDILKVVREPKFPKRADPQIKFLADSLAGRPNVEPRTSRDICAKERAKDRGKSAYKIIRKEFYVECSCGYEGPAWNNACRKCGAEISVLPDMLLGGHLS
jgi:hypothetical protein